ncbi:MAG TPA: hypothetical protein VFI27_06315 [candidate division Zixibacteria bacterium]|nr:hypothetical protein [candidate division Zixibacteria bacterium]
MFAEIQFTSVTVETVLADYIIRGLMHSRGEILNFLNDRNYPSFSLHDCEVHPLAVNRKVEMIRQDVVTIQKSKVVLVSVLDQGVGEKAQLTVSKRRVTFYCGQFAIHGQIHVPADAPDEDIIDETRDFFGMTEGSVYPLMPVGTEPYAGVPLILINRMTVEAYSAIHS